MIDEIYLYKEFINRCIKENKISVVNKLVNSFISENIEDEIKQEMNLHQIDILIEVLEDYKNNYELQNIKEKLIIYKKDIEN